MDALLSGASAWDGGYESPTVRWTRLGPGRRDGAATYCDVAYDEGCGYFVYTGPPRPFR